MASQVLALVLADQCRSSQPLRTAMSLAKVAARKSRLRVDKLDALMSFVLLFGIQKDALTISTYS